MWFLKALLSALISRAFAAARSFVDMLRKEAQDEERGRLGAEQRQAEEGRKAEQEIAEEAAKGVTEDQAISRLEKGDA